MNLKQLRDKRAGVLREAEALKRADGTFADDATRAAFDSKMAEIEALDGQIRAAEEADRQAGGPVDAEAVRAQERARQSGIRDAVRVAGLDTTYADELCRGELTLDGARAAIFTKLAERSRTQGINNQTVEVGEASRDKFLRGAENWLLVRSGMSSLVAKHHKVDVRTIDPGEFRGLSLMDLAREVLQRAGVSTRGRDKMDLAGSALALRSNFQSNGDFAVLLENTMNKILQAAYAAQADTWSRWCGVATASDFRQHNWYRTGALSVLDDVNDAGEIKNKSIPDGEKGTFTVGSKGNIVAISRQTVVNDDIGFAARLMAQLGRSGKLTIEKAAFALLAQNSGLGPTQSDSQPLFHSNRSNVGTGAALSAAALDADRVVMRQQLDPNGQDYLDLNPSVLLVPVSLGGQAKVINTSTYDPDTLANKSQMKGNVAYGLFQDIVDSPRISGTRRYLFADPTMAPVFVVAFLEGQQEPIIDSQDGWRTDGVELRARLDVGVSAVDYRGAVTNAGA